MKPSTYTNKDKHLQANFLNLCIKPFKNKFSKSSYIYMPIKKKKKKGIECF